MDAKRQAIDLIRELRVDRRISSADVAVLMAGCGAGETGPETVEGDVSTVRGLFDALGGTEAVAAILKRRERRVETMYNDNDLPVVYWPQIIDACKDFDPPVTSDMLMSMHLNRRSTEQPTSAIDRALAILGRQADLAAAMGISQGTLSRQLSTQTPLTAEQCLKVEAATGGKVTKSDLRPDLWPEVKP